MVRQRDVLLDRVRQRRLPADRLLVPAALVSISSASAADIVTVLAWIVGIVAGVFIVLTGVYCGFAMSYCKSLPFWNTGLLPIVFVIMGIADGLALTMGVSLHDGQGRGHRDPRVLEPHPARGERPADRRRT